MVYIVLIDNDVESQTKGLPFLCLYRYTNVGDVTSYTNDLGGYVQYFSEHSELLNFDDDTLFLFMLITVKFTLLNICCFR